jgi:hypothetical protein
MVGVSAVVRPGQGVDQEVVEGRAERIPGGHRNQRGNGLVGWPVETGLQEAGLECEGQHRLSGARLAEHH